MHDIFVCPFSCHKLEVNRKTLPDQGRETSMTLMSWLSGLIECNGREEEGGGEGGSMFTANVVVICKLCGSLAFR